HPIAMNDALLVRGFKRFANVLRDIERLFHRNRTACDPLGQRFSLHKFEHEIARAVRFQCLQFLRKVLIDLGGKTADTEWSKQIESDHLHPQRSEPSMLLPDGLTAPA